MDHRVRAEISKQSLNRLEIAMLLGTWRQRIAREVKGWFSLEHKQHIHAAAAVNVHNQHLLLIKFSSKTRQIKTICKNNCFTFVFLLWFETERFNDFQLTLKSKPWVNNLQKRQFCLCGSYFRNLVATELKFVNIKEPLHLSPVTWLVGYRDDFCCLFIWEI